MRAPFWDDGELDEALAISLLDRATMTDAVAEQVKPSVSAKLALARAVFEILGQLVVWQVRREQAGLEADGARLLSQFESGRVLTLRSPAATVAFARSRQPDAVIYILDLVIHEHPPK